MINLNTAFPSKYLKAADLNAHDPNQPITIARVGTENMTDKKTGEIKSKVIVHFYELAKPLIFNVTNFRSLAKSFGGLLPHEDVSRLWVGQQVLMHTELVPAFGETVNAIRVRPYIPPVTQTLIPPVTQTLPTNAPQPAHTNQTEATNN